MNKIEINKNRLIFSDFFSEKIKDNPLILIDIGARGNLDEPWKSIDQKSLKVFGFEPDGDECLKLNKISTNRKYFPYALWSENKKIEINVTENPFCSSIYEPNLDLIKTYEGKHWTTRKTKEKTNYQAKTLDDTFDQKINDFDFIKIDTQGAEYEILRGAKNTINKTFAVLTETWTTEVYKNAPFTEDVMKIMRENEFELFDTKIAASWKRNTANFLKTGKRQVIGLDLLFFKKVKDIKNFQKLLKIVAISELYGFPDYALEIINANQKNFPNNLKDLERIKNEIIINSNPKFNFVNKILKKIKSIFGYKYNEYPSLHY